MERSSALCLAGLLACTAHLTASLDTSPALQRPVHLSVVALIICGAALVLLEKIRPLRSRSAGKEQQYAPIPLSDLAEGNSSRPTSPVQADTPVPEYRPKLGLKLYCALVVFLICCRVEILRQVMNAIECATSSMETAVPVLITLADWWLVQRKRQPPREEDDDDMDSTVYGDLLGRIAASNWRPLLTAVLLSWSSSAVLTSASPAASTYICSHVSREYSMIPRLQVAGLILDGFLSVLLFLLLDSSSRCSWSFGPKGAVSLGLSCLLSASIWILIAAGIYAWGPANYRMLISPTPMFFTSSAIKLAVELSIAVVCALHTIRAIGLSNTSILVLFTSAYTSLFLSTWNHSHPFPPLSGGMVLALTALVIGMIIHSIPLSSDFDGARTSRPRSFSRLWGFYPILAVLYFFQLMLVYHGDNEVRYHPIDALVYDAKERHDAWLKWASNSSSVEIAAADYTARYKRHPPPHFDEWYAYAVEHSSRIINDFDSIHEDLLPYWSLSPAEIRQRTWDSIADPSKGIGGILIRDGKAHIAPNVPRNQRLMLDGIIKMIEQFGQWLPDMDLAFNLNNECRVAIPYEEMESARSDAVSALANEKPPSELTNAFSDGRADGWHQLPDDEHNSEHFVTLSSRSIWDEFGSITCPPDSPARTQSLWNRRDYCASCALPHSLGAFFANSTLAADICHQPDLANLHGFYTSPNVFIGTNSLIPIFSQSKAPGFNDILYPSAWNYMDRVPYAANDEHRDPPFDDKKPTIFWRGATTEGFAAPDSTAWHGMTRQRMVHALSITSAPQTLPLPHPVAAYKRKLRYAAVPAPALRASIPLDVAVSDVVRCAEPACAAERALLAPSAEKIDFQAHWLHRYLLDADGSGFSGRFLAFLRSRCLPVKVAPLFREWWHGRVTPWLHYVPVDPRLQGLWATLAYLRGVDMEVYFFRLLLEWGRLTDDARDGVGYVPVGGGVGEAEGK